MRQTESVYQQLYILRAPLYREVWLSKRMMGINNESESESELELGGKINFESFLHTLTLHTLSY